MREIGKKMKKKIDNSYGWEVMNGLEIEIKKKGKVLRVWDIVISKKKREGREESVEGIEFGKMEMEIDMERKLGKVMDGEVKGEIIKRVLID